MTATISLTETENELLQTLSEHTGRTREELIHEGLELLRARFSKEQRRAVLQRAAGLWRDRDDLPTLEELRGEWDRREP